MGDCDLNLDSVDEAVRTTGYGCSQCSQVETAGGESSVPDPKHRLAGLPKQEMHMNMRATRRAPSAHHAERPPEPKMRSEWREVRHFPGFRGIFPKARRSGAHETRSQLGSHNPDLSTGASTRKGGLASISHLDLVQVTASLSRLLQFRDCEQPP